MESVTDTDQDVFTGYGVRVSLPDTDGSFLKVKETLTRIGIASKPRDDDGPRTLTQSCHILHKHGQYAIVHFKELFSLDGKYSDISEDDLFRRNVIAKLLADWNLVSLQDAVDISISNVNVPRTVTIVPYKDKSRWEFKSKYTFKYSKKVDNHD